MNKILAVLGMLLVGVSAFAASPTFNSFDTTRFTANAAANSVDLKIAGIDTNYFSAATMAYLASLAGAGGGSSNAFNISQFSSNANFVSIRSAALLTNTVLQAASGGDVRTIFANQVPGTIVQGDGTYLSFDALGGINISYTNGATPVYLGKSVLVNGGVTGTEAGVPWNIGYLAALGVLTNSSTGDLGTLSYAQLATVLGVFGTTNSIFGGTFGTNANTGQTVIDAQGNISHTSTNSTYVVYRREGTNGTPPLLSIAGTNSTVTVTNLILTGSVSCPTNSALGGAVIDFSMTETTTNASGTVAYTSFLNFNSVGYNWKIIHVLASGGDRTITFPTNTKLPVPPACVCTNGTQKDILIQLQQGVFTNALWFSTY